MKGLKGDSRNSNGKALVYKGRRCTTAKSKVNAFLQEYADGNGKKSNKDTRREEVELSRGLKETAVPRQEEECDFPYQELMWARNKIKNRKAAGPDEIISDLLREREREIIDTLVCRETSYIHITYYTLTWCLHATFLCTQLQTLFHTHSQTFVHFCANHLSPIHFDFFLPQNISSNTFSFLMVLTSF